MSNRKLLDQMGVLPESRTTSNWARINLDKFNDEEKERIKALRRAVKLYVETSRDLKSISRECQISDDEIRRVVKRCYKIESDGQISGFRALLPYRRQESYTRTKRYSPKEGDPKSGHASGSFISLLRQFPELIPFLNKHAFGKVVDDEPRQYKEAYTDIHTALLRKLRNLGVTDDQYPFTLKSLGYESLRRYLNSLKDKDVEQFSKTRLMSKSRRMPILPREDEHLKIWKPYDRIEFDAHTEDCSVCFSIPTPEGLFINTPLERLAFLPAIDSASRAILGYSVPIRRHFNSDNIDEAFYKSIVPWKPMELDIPDLSYPPGAGLPSGVIPGCEWRLWSLVAMDNAWAHYSENSRYQLTNNVHCTLNYGKTKIPEARMIVERFFETLAKYIHQLPSTTGSHPEDRRRTEPEINAVKYGVTLDFIFQLIDVIVAEYNITPHSELPGGHSPLSYIREFLAQGDMPRQVFEEERDEFSLSKQKIIKKIRGNVADGRRPYLFYNHVIYQNSVIGSSPSLIGKEVICVIDRDDGRFMEIFLRSTGESLGIAKARGAWGVYKHTHRQRAAIFKKGIMRHLNFSNIPGYVNPMRAAKLELAKRAHSSKKAATEYAELVYELRSNPDEQHTPQDPYIKSSRVVETEEGKSISNSDWIELGRTIIG